MSSLEEDIGFDWCFKGQEAPVATELGEQTAAARMALDASTKSVLALQKLISQRGRRSANANRCFMMVDDFFVGLQDMKMKLDRIEAGDASAASEIPGLLEAFRESLNFDRLLAEMKGYRKGNETALAEYIGTSIEVLSSEFARVSEAVRPLSDALAIEAVSQNVRSQLSAVTGYKFHGKAPNLTALNKSVAEPVLAPVVEPVVAPRAAEPIPARVERQAPSLLDRAAAYLSGLQAEFGGSARRLVPALATGLVLALGGCTPENANDASSAPTPPPRRVLIPIAEPAPAPVVAPAPTATFTVDSTAKTLWGAIQGAIEDECGLSGGALQRATGERVRVSFEQQKTGFGQLLNGMEAGDSDASRLGAVQEDLRGYGITVPITYAGVRNDGVNSIGNVGAYDMDGNTIVTYAQAALSGYTCPSK